jgi:hypothetical protein
MAFRLGLAFPAADATGESGDSLGSRYAWQIPIAIDIGAKVTERAFVGGYFGIGFGSTGSDSRVEAACNDDDDDLENDISCSALTMRAGLAGHYAFQPGERMNPWLGYGFGYEGATATISDSERAYRETVSMSGYTYGELMGGLDLRNSAVGAGPFASIAVGQFTHSSTEVDERRLFGGEVDDRALHVWLTFGMRIVVNP